MLLKFLLAASIFFSSASSWLFVPSGSTPWSNTKSTIFSSGEKVNVAYAAVLDWAGATGRTWSIWYKQAGDNGGMFFSHDNDGIEIFTFGDFVRFRFWGSAGGNLDGNANTTISTTVGVWTHIVVTSSGSKTMAGMKVYYNAVSKTLSTNENSLTGNDTLSSNGMTIGKRDSDTNWNLVGNLDEATIWDVEMSGTDVTNLYNSGHPADPTTHAQAANLVFYAPMGDGDTYPTLIDRKNGNNGTMNGGMVSGDIVSDVP